MTEAGGGGAERMMGAAPEWIGAVFEQGNRKNQVTDIYRRPPEILVPVCDVETREGRREWVFENMRVFLDGTVASPERQWKNIIDNWLSELRFAANRASLGRKELKETEDDLKAMMAICSSARAMEISTGTASTYLTYVTLSQEGKNLDVQDTWADFLLHNDPGKLERIVGVGKEPGANFPRFPLIRHYYDQIVKDAGIGLEGDSITILSIDRDRALKGNLVKYLAKNRPPGVSNSWRRTTSLNEYLSDVLLEPEEDAFKQLWGSDSYRWTCAKIAADAFLVNLYTQWEYDIDKEGELELKPLPTWGGDPFRPVLEPSFLPRRIKRVYTGRDSVLLDLVDLAFRPEGSSSFGNTLSPQERTLVAEKSLKPSATSHLKAYARYSNALWAFFGSSRGMGIPVWDKKTMGESLPSIVENLDQIYGNFGSRENPNLGKQVLGLMIVRIIHAKALAAAMETSRPGFSGKMAIIFGEEKARPFLDVRQFLYGPNLDAKDGFFEDLAGARTRVVFSKKSVFKDEIVKRWEETWDLLASGDQTPEGRKSAKTLNYLGFIIDSLTAISQTRKRG